MLTGIAGASFVASPGDTIDVDDDTARRLVESGAAEAATAKKKPAKKAAKAKGDD